MHKIARKPYYSIFQNHLYFLKRRWGAARVEISFPSNPHNYLYHIMTAVPVRDAVFLLAVWCHERWCTAAGEPWQCITAPGEPGRWIGVWEARENSVEGKRPREKWFKRSGVFAFLYWLLRFLKNKSIARNCPNVQYSLSLQCWICTFSSLTSPLAVEVKPPCRFSLKTWQNLSSCREGFVEITHCCFYRSIIRFQKLFLYVKGKS